MSFKHLLYIKDCLGHPYRSQLCADCEKWNLSFWICCKPFVNKWWKAILNCGDSPKWSHGSTKKIEHFLDLEGITTFLWFPTIVAEKLGYLNKWKLLAPTLLDDPLKRLVWIRHWPATHAFTPIRLFHKHVYAAQITNVWKYIPFANMALYMIPV